MPKETQISAYVSDATKQRLDLFVAETGVKKGRVIEDALNKHLDALDELPADAIVPTQITVDAASLRAILDAENDDDRPTDALRRLMSGA